MITAINGSFSYHSQNLSNYVNSGFKGRKLEVLGEHLSNNGSLAEISKEAAEVLRNNAIINDGIKINIVSKASDLLEKKGSVLEHIMPSGTKVEVTLSDVISKEVRQISPNTVISPIEGNTSVQSFGAAEEFDKLIHFTQDGIPVSMDVPKGSLKQGFLDGNNLVVPKEETAEVITEAITETKAITETEATDKLIHFTQDGIAVSMDVPKGSLKQGFLDGNNLVVPNDSTELIQDDFNSIIHSDMPLSDGNEVFSDFLTSGGDIPIDDGIASAFDNSEGLDAILDVIGG